MIRIIADSTCDLSKELIEKYNIDIIPLHIYLGDKEYEDGITITPDEIYKWADENNSTPKTAAVSMGNVVDKFKTYINNGDKIICFAISDLMSSTRQIMQMAANELEAEDNISVIDSENLSTGIGLLVIEAAIMVNEGKSLIDIVNKIEKLKKNVKSSFIVDTLTYLHRGGRCSGITALAGGMLKIHPTIVVEDGKMVPKKKYRGKLSSAINLYANDLKNNLLKAKKERVFITHSGCDEKIVNDVYNFLKNLNYFDEILITRAGGVVSSHCGPGTLGILFIDN